MEEKSDPEEQDKADEQAQSRATALRRASKTRKRSMSVVMRKQIHKKGFRTKELLHA